eukprot:TRINITY_DN68040_c4_g1_i12.p1 TRINITY_DN68040_c4_g1~~TRINITY_DN68040_c4_g1_i12.p1  ORF type:complete len:192 (-),score=24.62 TRINITY_DN68040_c4_g1_i12:371-946(-)
MNRACRTAAINMEPETEFAVTTYLCESAIIKLAQYTPKLDACRGLKGEMPARIAKMYHDGAHFQHGEVICDPSLVSSTKNEKVAIFGKYAGNLLWVLHNRKHDKIFLRGGGDVSWCSQFPAEEEMLYPCYTELWPTRKGARCAKKKYTELDPQDVYEWNTHAYYNPYQMTPYVPGFMPPEFNEQFKWHFSR